MKYARYDVKNTLCVLSMIISCVYFFYTHILHPHKSSFQQNIKYF